MNMDVFPLTGFSFNLFHWCVAIFSVEALQSFYLFFDAIINGIVFLI